MNLSTAHLKYLGAILNTHKINLRQLKIELLLLFVIVRNNVNNYNAELMYMCIMILHVLLGTF